MITLKAKEGYVYSNGEIYSDVVYLSDIDSVDNWKEIERDGVQYADAIDPVGLGRTYTETTTKAESDSLVESSQADELVDIIMGKED